MALVCAIKKKFGGIAAFGRGIRIEDVTGIFNKPQTLLLEKLI